MPDLTQRPDTSAARTGDLSETERRRALSAERQRLVFDVLSERSAATDPAERPPAVGLDRLAATVARRERRDPRVDSETVRRTEHSLHHIHLPKMAALGLLDYDREARCVESWQCRRRPR